MYRRSRRARHALPFCPVTRVSFLAPRDRLATSQSDLCSRSQNGATVGPISFLHRAGSNRGKSANHSNNQ
jgi:hypothetical protein